MNYSKFEELPCWQKARDLCREISRVTDESGLKRNYIIRDQIWRAAGSVMDNIAEGFDDGSPRECIRFLGYSQRSCGEVQSKLYRAFDCECISQNRFSQIYDLATECRKQIKGFRKYLRDFNSGRNGTGMNP
ncbi:S23 ribosomal protein [Syntrophobacter sp. SbD1]|nr:S23 ribosomal protein [Syntrophobacter sp. SbD1]